MNINSIPDAISAAPEVHMVAFENDKVRVLDVKVPSGTKTAMHSHPDNVSYIVIGGKLKFTLPDGSSKEVDLVPGQVTAPGAGAHIVENTGTSEVHAVQVEFKG